ERKVSAADCYGNYSCGDLLSCGRISPAVFGEARRGVVPLLIKTHQVSGGEGGIRTHGTVPRTLAFEASTFNRSVTSPRSSTPIILTDFVWRTDRLCRSSASPSNRISDISRLSHAGCARIPRNAGFLSI